MSGPVLPASTQEQPGGQVRWAGGGIQGTLFDLDWATPEPSGQQGGDPV